MPVADSFETVLDAARSGAEWAWSRLLGDVDGTLRGYVRRQGGVDVDDLMSETWLHVVRGLNRFSGDETAFRSWVFMIAHHRIIDERRRLSRRPIGYAEEEALEEAGPRAPSAEAEGIDRIGEEDLQLVLEQLSPSQREVVLLRFVAGFGVTETAEIVGKNPGAVQALQRRAFRRLEKILHRDGTFLS